MNTGLSSEDLPDLNDARLENLEHRVQDMVLEINHIHDMIKETHKFIIQLGKNQAYLAERVSRWPYVRVDSSRE
jgi:uncharacterized coiled-coil protein SlyX